MHKLILVAGVAAAVLLPSLAFAQPSCDEVRRDRIRDAPVSADIRGLLGANNASAYADCAHAYGYYDQNSQWHANAIDRANARGYFDRDGVWVEGAPQGYYDGAGHWVSVTVATSANGYYDTAGRWIPASAAGYYDERGQWVASVSGHYDDHGIWIAGQTTGAYDAGGHWMPGARSGHVGANGAWIADSQPGYYDAQHQWRAGPSRGYYDTSGAWVAIAAATDIGTADVSHSSEGDRRDVDTREAWLEQRIRTAAHDGALDQDATASDLDRLDAIRREESGMRNQVGQLSSADEARLQGRLDRLSASLRQSLGSQYF
jgi:hypothetical protein